MSLTVREKYIWQQMENEKHLSFASYLPGRPHFVLPTTDYDAYSNSAFVRNNHKLVYDTAALALAACVDGRGDAIVLMPGTHTVATASLAASKSALKILGVEAFLGLPVRKPTAILTTSVAGDEIMNVTAPDCGVIGVTVQPITASDAIDLSADADGFLMDQCFVDLFTPAVNIATAGITLAAATDLKISRSTFISDGAQGNAIVGTAAIQSSIEDCTIFNTTGTWASAILCGAATTGLLILRNLITSYGTALTAGVNGTGATIASGVQCVLNHFGSLVTVPVDNFDAGECELSENYQLGVGAMDGGALIIVIT